MIRFLVRAGIFLGSAAVGLLVASLLVDQMSISATSFLIVVVIFAALQSVLAPFLAKTTARNAPALLGAAGLLSTFLALLITTVVSDGLSISGASSWLVASLIVWLVTMLATLLLPWLLVKAGVQQARQRRAEL
jgi:uncharacterized membrane protein YvlD (DUF360 family)